MRTLPILLLALAGCQPTAEEPDHRFTESAMPRFTVTKEVTPPGNPDLWLIKDSARTNEVLVLRYNDGLSAVLLK